MQSYVVSNLLRTIGGRVGLLFCMLLLSINAWSSDNASNSVIERDSLFSRWNKTRSTLPTLIYKLKDFADIADRVEVESLIRTYGVGGVILSNGNKHEVSQWISKNRQRRREPILHGVDISTVFELPFNELPEYPNQLSVECLASNHLVYQLGQSHALQLLSMGIGIAEFSNIPKYYSDHELKKLTTYMLGLSDGGIRYYISDKNLSEVANLNLSALMDRADILDVNQITSNGMLGKKTLKKYRKEKQDQRPVIDAYRSVEATLDQIDNGVTLLTVSGRNRTQNLVNAMLLKDMPGKNCYKKEVKTYFGITGQIEQQLKSITDPVFKWKNQEKSFENIAITLVQDSKGLIPINELNDKQLITISNDSVVFETRVDRYKSASHLLPEILLLGTDSLLKIMPEHALILVDFLSDSSRDISDQYLDGCISLSQHRSVIVIGNSTKLVNLKEGNELTILFAPEYKSANPGVLVEMAFGARAIHGALPGYMAEDGSRRGAKRDAIGKLIYDSEYLPDHSKLNQIETIVSDAIADGVMPGCQIMMVKDGRVVYDRSFGYLTYDSLTHVRWDHLYDIASVTKTVATLPAVMKDVENGYISMSGHLGDYLPAFCDSDKSELEVADLLTHQSGLKSYIPFWRRAKYDMDSADFLYKERIRRNKYNYQSINWQDSIQNWIADSKYNRLANDDGSFRYLYSDLGFMIMKDVVETNCSCSMDQAVEQNFYEPLGMDHTLFNPLTRFEKSQIAPTEQDDHFRSELLQGVVHDKNAALLGGVSGHAGLFSNANDLAKFMYMMMHGGQYGGTQYFEDSLIRTFTTKQNRDDRRALGWDKPYRSVGNASRFASDASFGHSGFTGTLVWADPSYDLIYIFLSNRIYPDPQNYKLIKNNTRTKIHDLMYESFLNLGGDLNPDM